MIWEWFFSYFYFIGFNLAKIAVFFLNNSEWSQQFHNPSLLTLWFTFPLRIQGSRKALPRLNIGFFEFLFKYFAQEPVTSHKDTLRSNSNDRRGQSVKTWPFACNFIKGSPPLSLINKFKPCNSYIPVLTNLLRDPN